MQIYCDNKKCYKETEALLDTETNEVICQSCLKSISSVNNFIKKTMVDLKQVVKKKVIANGIYCEKCKKTSVPLRDQNKFNCGSCKQKLNLSPVMENFLKMKNSKTEDI